MTQPEWPDVDADLTAASCMGIGLQFPHLWEIVKRYILRGDNYFQNGGLATLVANIWSMPLDEAADVLDQYYKQHDYFPPAAGQRGGVNLAGLQALHAVATAPDFTEPAKTEERKALMLRLLERHRQEVQKRLAPSAGPKDFMSGDRAAVEETIAAVRADKPWEVKLNPSAGTTEAQEKAATGSPAGAETGSRAAAVETTPSSVSPSDLIKAKYGYDHLDQRITYVERAFAERVSALGKNIDRFMGQRQVEVGNKQVRVGRWGIVIGAAIGIAGSFLAPPVLHALGIAR